MPAHFQTPAPSRRFLPASSSANAATPKSHALSSTRPGVKFTQSSQTFGSAQPSRFRNVSVVSKDDIDTSFGDAVSSPPLPSRTKGTTREYGLDDIGDSDYVVPEGENMHSSAYLGSKKHRGSGFGSTNAGKTSRQNTSAHCDDSSTDLEDLFPRKRRRHSRPEQSIKDDASPGPRLQQISPTIRRQSVVLMRDSIELHDEDMVDDGAHKLSSSSESDVSSGLAPSVTSSRFRLPTAAFEPRLQTATKPSFMLPANKRSSNLARTAPTALPETFSPSRRRGKQDYTHGGAAETVRNWVLGLAAEETQSAVQQYGTIQVQEVVRDSSGRCAIVTAENGKKWLLVGQQGRNATTEQGAGQLSRIKEGTDVLLKGAGTKWSLDLAQSVEGNESEQQDTFDVSVLWEVREARDRHGNDD